MLKKLYLAIFVAFCFVSNTALATVITDNFDTDPFLGRWTNERGTSVWNSTNLEFDLGDNQARPGARYVQTNPGSVDEEAQVTFQHTNQFSDNTQGGPAIRFRDDGTDDWYWVTVNASNDTYTLFRNNDGGATQLAQGTLAITTGDFITIRLAASGGVGGNVLLNVWIQDHGSSKPSDPGWIGNDNSPNLTFTDTDPSRLNTANHIQVGIAGEAFGMPVDSRHDYFKARAISDRTGGVTPPPPAGDTTPPVISSISVSSITTAGATITWTTNESSSAVVQYGPTTSYGQTQSSGGTTSHSVTLSGLNSSTQYNFRISATDTSNNNSVSANQTFSTQAVVTPTPTPTPPPPVSGTSTFDSSDYRQNTYGVPNRYADPTRALNNPGAGTLANPWNLSQAMNLAVAGDVVGILPGVSVLLPAPNHVRFPAFNPINSGTANARIIFVTKYAAVGLPNVATNPNRTQLRHAGTRAVATGDTEQGTGGPTMGSYFMNYITFDGFYIDLAEAQPKGDGGVIRTEHTIGVQFKNFEIKGINANMQSNPIIYRPQYSRDNVLSNFRVYDFSNDRTGSNTGQDGLFSDQYGDANFLIEHFEIRNTQNGIFTKGSATYEDVRLNYGTIRYGIISNVLGCYRFHALDTTFITTLEYNICYDESGSSLAPGVGINLSSELTPAINLLIHHNTVARVNSTVNTTSGAIGSYSTGIGNNVVIRDNLVDVNSGGPYGRLIDFGAISTLPSVLNYNGYYKNGATLTWGFNGTEYNTFSSWRSATNRDANSQVLASSPFVDRANANFTITPGHPAKTMSSTGGEIGAYAGSETVGVMMPTGTYPSTGVTPTPPPPTPTPLAGDLNVDHVINSLDWSIMNSQWFTSNSQSDLRVDGQVNSLDFAILSSNWGRTW
jgi:hypothetical protein